MSGSYDRLMSQIGVTLRMVDPLAKVQGCSPEEIAAAEQALGVTLPPVYRAFLKHLGWNHGPLLRGTDVPGAAELVEFQADARAAVTEWKPRPTLPTDAVVIAMHQGYRAIYLLPVSAEDGPVYEVQEGRAEPLLAAPTFRAFLEEHVAQLVSAVAAHRDRGRA